jgi:hypothetical protein
MMQMMGIPGFSGTGFICCAGVSNRGEVFRLLDPMAVGSTIANLIATGREAETLRSVSDRMITTNVAGMVVSPPGALRPEVQVTSVAPVMSPMVNLNVATAPAVPAPRPAPESYGDCVLRCIASKVPGITVEELLNLPCNIGLLAMGALPATTGPLSVAALPAAVVALAGCVAATFGLTVGAILECFIACAPGGRLRPEEEDDEGDDDDDDDNGSGSRSAAAAMARMEQMTRIAAAVYREAAARGVHLTQAQVAQIVRRHYRP